MSSSDRLIVTLHGRDAPGITSEVTAVVAAADAQLVDVRQTVVRGRLTLVVELQPSVAGAVDSLFLGILRASKRCGLTVDFDTAPQTTASCREHPPTHYVLTVLSESEIQPLFLEMVATMLARADYCVEKVTRLSASSMRCLELVFATTRTVSSADLNLLRKELYAFGMEHGIDVALQAESVMRRSKRLVVMDMDRFVRRRPLCAGAVAATCVLDRLPSGLHSYSASTSLPPVLANLILMSSPNSQSTLIQQEVIDEIARYAGVFEEVESITHRAMNGELDFNQSLEHRVAYLAGTPASVFEKVIDNLVYTDGARELCRSLKTLGYRLAVISGGFKPVTEHVRKTLGLDYDYANQLEVTADGFFTGRTIGPVVNAQRKADLLATIAQKEGITLDQCVAIGDGSNDLPMLGTAGLGIAFNAKPAVQNAASFRIVRLCLSIVDASSFILTEVRSGESGHRRDLC
jgi:phosphoserine phosphatase